MVEELEVEALLDDTREKAELGTLTMGIANASGAGVCLILMAA